MCDMCVGGDPIEQLASAKEYEYRRFGKYIETDEDYAKYYGTKIDNSKAIDYEAESFRTSLRNAIKNYSEQYHRMEKEK